MQKRILEEILILVTINLLNLKISRCRMLIRNRVKKASMHLVGTRSQRVGGKEAGGFPNSVFLFENAKRQKI